MKRTSGFVRQATILALVAIGIGAAGLPGTVDAKTVLRIGTVLAPGDPMGQGL